MADTNKHIPDNLELTGKYLAAMKTISAHLMNRLPEGEALWRTLGQTEALLLEAQMTETPLEKIFGKGGVAGFCQSVVDELVEGKTNGSIPAAEHKSKAAKPRQTANEQIKKKKNLITAAVLLLWCLLIAFLVGQYTGYLTYLFSPADFYLSELHNFRAEETVIPDSKITLSVPVRSTSSEPQILYRSGDYTVSLTYVGFDEDSYTEGDPLRRWWVEFSYTQISDFSEVTYVSPAQSGTATVTLASGEVLTQPLHWQGDGYYGDTAYVRLYFLEIPKDTPTDGLSAEISFDDMTLVRWIRAGIGIRAK